MNRKYEEQNKKLCVWISFMKFNLNNDRESLSDATPNVAFSLEDELLIYLLRRCYEFFSILISIPLKKERRCSRISHFMLNMQQFFHHDINFVQVDRETIYSANEKSKLDSERIVANQHQALINRIQLNSKAESSLEFINIRQKNE
jgi:hypothetical protein